jgi:hypothetical protein
MQIYISHAKADANLASGLSASLAQAGFSVWNPESILPGDNWRKEFGAALESSELMVALFSRNARENENANVTRDVQFALTSGNYRGRVVPVLVDFVTFEAGSEVPWVLLKMDPVYLAGPSPDFSEIINRVRGLAGKPSNAAH